MSTPSQITGSLPVSEVQRQQTSQTVLASAVRTATTVGPDQSNTVCRGIIYYLNVTAASGTGGLKLEFDAKDSLSGNYVALYGAGPSTAVTSTGTSVWMIHPYDSGFNPQGGDKLVGFLPCTFRVKIVHGDATSYTYSLSCDYLI